MLSILFLAITVWLMTVHAASAAREYPLWPNGPFETDGPHILDSSGATFIYVGANWPGEGEVIILKGLQYSSTAEIVTKVKSIGMNSVRMGWAVEMVDDLGMFSTTAAMSPSSTLWSGRWGLRMGPRYCLRSRGTSRFSQPTRLGWKSGMPLLPSSTGNR